MCSLILQYAGVAPASVIAASGLKAGTVAGFEVDGDLKSGNGASNPGNVPAGLIASLTDAQDWLDGNATSGLVDPPNEPESFLFRDKVDTSSVEGDVSPDTSAHVGGNKEVDTRDWGYFNNAGPNNKTDYRHVMAGVKVSGGNPYVFLGAERIDTNGTMVVDFELNQKPFKEFPGAPGVAKPDRSINDILISLEYANGGSNPEVTLYRVSAVQEFNAGQVVTFATISNANTINAVRSATNFQTLAGVAFPSATYDVAAFAWAEASVNLNALELPVTCLNFGQGSIRSRTGGAPDASQLKDASQPFPLSVNTCGKITVEKRDKITNDLVAGATFKFEPDPTVGSNKASLTVTDGGADDPDGKADGKVVFAACEPDTYTVTELAPPPGYFPPANLDDTKTVVSGGSATFVFEDPLAKIEWIKEDASGGLLGGATFTITPNPRTGSGSLEVVDNGPHDVDDTAGEFRVNRVLIGGPYVIAETAPPAGYIGTGATASVTILASMDAPYLYTVDAGTFVNTLGSLAWQKEDVSGGLLAGATFKVTGPFGYDQTVVDNSAPDADPADGKFLLVDLKTGEYTVTETAAPSGYILDSGPAKATVSAGTPNPTIAAKTFVNHLAKITWVKYGPDGKTLLGGASFSVTPDPYSAAASLTVKDNDVHDADPDAGEFQLDSIKTGTYEIVETVAPAGFVLDATKLTAVVTQTLKSPYTVDAGSVTNTLGSISWVKNGPDGEELLGGATFTITPNPQTGSGSLVVVDDGANDADKTPGQFKVASVLVDSDAPHYSIAETAAPAGYVGDTSVVTVNPTTANPDVSVAAGTWINTLGSLIWEKRDGDGALLGGATFEVTFPDASVVTVVDNSAPDTDPDAGQFKLVGLKLGAYTVTETVAPAGYVRDAAPRNATLTAASPDVEITNDFVNTLGSISWVKNGPNGTSLLGGATFTITPNPQTGSGTLVVLDDGANDADKDPGEFKVERVLVDKGEYSIAETTAPAGYIGDDSVAKVEPTTADPDVSVAAGTWVNTLGELSWTKDNGKGTLVGGATFSVTPNPFTGTGSLSVTDNDANDKDASAGKFQLKDVRVGTYAIKETASPEGYVLDGTTCSVTVDAGNPTGTKVCSFHNTPIPPAIDIVKTAGASAGSQAADGATHYTESYANNVTYKYVVTNTGQVRLTDVWVRDDNGTPANTEDDFLPACLAADQLLSQPFELAVGASVTCYATLSITTDTTNIAKASGKSAGEGTDVQATDDAKVEIIGPAITIVKTAGASQASQAADGETFVTEAGTGNVVYKYVVTNTGDTALNTVALVDDKLGTISCGGQTTLAVGASMTCYATASVMDDTVNVADVTAKSPAGAPVEATDDASVILRHVSIQKTNDATEPLLEGEDVVYTLTFAVVNGPIPSMTVTDTLPAEVVNPRDFSVAPADVTGQVITWNLTNVADGAKITYTATIDAGTPAGTYTNTAEITEGPCTADGCTSDSEVEVITPDVTIAKSPMPATVLVGEDVVFEIVATNAGPGTAYDVEITDELPAGLAWTEDSEDCEIADGKLSCDVGDLAEGSTFTVKISAPTSAEDLEACSTPLEIDNTAKVTAVNETKAADQLPNEDDASVDVLCADISLVKTAGDAADGAILKLATPGNVTFKYVVENTGSATLTDFHLVDDHATPANTADDVTVSCPEEELAPGATMTCTVILPVSYGTWTNTAVVTGHPVLDPETKVSDSDDAVVTVPEPVKPTPKPTPKVTPPPTSTIDGADSGTTGTTGLLLVLASLAGLMLAAGYMRPARAAVRRRSRKG